jgi:glutaredoxin
MAAHATANASAGRRGTAAAAPSFFTTLPGRMLLVAVIALLFFAGKAWLHGSRGGGSPPGVVAAVEIYTTSYCDTCKIAKAYMRRHGIAYTEYDVEADIDRRREFYDRGGKGTPLIFVRGQRMEGFDVNEFEKLRRGRS